jgi:hypothetical protein
MISSPWAIIKCRFSDDHSDVPPDALYENLFTRSGAGTMAMVDFFREMSHGLLDLGGSQVFGWFTLPIPADEYFRRLDENQDLAWRWLMQECRIAAGSAGVNLRAFRGVVWAMNRGRQVPGDDGIGAWGYLGGLEAFCDRNALTPSILGQEMTHGYGVAHSRRDGSAEDYQDPWDTMSTELAWMAPHPQYGFVGPGLNAVNMLMRDWFDRSRLWRCGDSGFVGRVRLRPLHRPDLPGFLAASLPDPNRPGREMILEFRTRRRWDAGIPEAAVLRHREEGRRSYLMGSRNMIEGDVLEHGRRNGRNHLRIDVVRIDEEEEVCDLEITCTQPSLADKLRSISGRLSRQVIGNVTRDGGGAVILPEGRIVPIGPWDPTMPMLRALAALQSAEPAEDPAKRLGIERETFAAIIESSQVRLDGPAPLRSPAPRPKAPAQAPRRGCLAIPFPKFR